MFAASEFWVYEQDTPRFDLCAIAPENHEGYVDFMGWQYTFSTFEAMQALGAQVPSRGVFDLWLSGEPGRRG
jgi:hypothetical protein